MTACIECNGGGWDPHGPAENCRGCGGTGEVKPPPQAAPDARALTDLLKRWDKRMPFLATEGAISVQLVCINELRALLPTAPPAETAELEALKEAARIYEEHSGSLDPEYEPTPLETAAVAWARAEREAAGGGK